ncbi:olfactory receptor 1L8-like [Ambystoma mexicanum]|uniref:olfactory receptor 1L8-like n=1 Tax=Ambystoma mexicanum TaxID=8296 RepID=UPI0037E8A930
MLGYNGTGVKEFILLGFSDKPDEQVIIFILFLLMYLTTVIGNLTIIMLAMTVHQLQTPMYFFLMILSFVDMCFSSVTVPRMLMNIVSVRKTVTIAGCFAQLFFIILFGGIECLLLGVMAYDRYVAICDPLHYSMRMSRKLCLQMVGGSCLSACAHSTLHVAMASLLSFCGSNQIHHFFCDMTPLLKLSCSDISLNELIIYFEAPLPVMTPFIIIVVSYILIATTIWKIPSTTGRHRAFSTCSSHLIVVTLFYGAIICTYFRPSSTHSLDSDRVVTTIYTVIAPMLNPFIYSLRNNEMKEAFKKVILRKHLRTTLNS